jgi:hypothetical protein
MPLGCRRCLITRHFLTKVVVDDLQGHTVGRGKLSTSRALADEPGQNGSRNAQRAMTIARMPTHKRIFMVSSKDSLSNPVAKGRPSGSFVGVGSFYPA